VDNTLIAKIPAFVLKKGEWIAETAGVPFAAAVGLDEYPWVLESKSSCLLKR